MLLPIIITTCSKSFCPFVDTSCKETNEDVWKPLPVKGLVFKKSCRKIPDYVRSLFSKIMFTLGAVWISSWTIIGSCIVSHSSFPKIEWNSNFFERKNHSFPLKYGLCWESHCLRVIASRQWLMHWNDTKTLEFLPWKLSAATTTICQGVHFFPCIEDGVTVIYS